MIEKRLLVPGRERRPTRDGFSWLDRRFLREFADRLTGDSILLYLFLVGVSDRQGLSFYSDPVLSARLRMRVEHVAQAREELLLYDLIAYERPLTQVLSLPPPRRARAGGEQPLLRGLFDSGERSGGGPRP